ncbi:MAG TPA: DoxX family protein [Blastocatellia bacterium]|nr:DoxX family protein [Blastocatellia bacterium]
MSEDSASLSAWQKVALIVLRTLIGWHFAYEGYYKMALPGWSSQGEPLGRWTAAGFIRAAKGPAAKLAQTLLDHGWGPLIDHAVIIGLLAAGISLMLGIFTRIGCWVAIALLALFYLTAIPLRGIPEPGGEGAYLLVNKNLIELAAVVALASLKTERIAGLDLLWRRRSASTEQALNESKPATTA